MKKDSFRDALIRKSEMISQLKQEHTPMEELDPLVVFPEPAVQEAPKRKGVSLKAVHQSLMGRWTVVEESIGGEDVLSEFIRTRLSSTPLMNPQMVSTYEFREKVCLKTFEVRGKVQGDEGLLDYRYRVCLTMSYRLKSAHAFIATLESGYLFLTLGDQNRVKDYQADGKEIEVQIKHEEDLWVLEETESSTIKRLRRML